MPRKATASTTNKQPTPSADDVDKIRDIIFGGQMREYAKRFDQLEREVTSAIDRMVKQVDKRFADLERSMGGQLQKMTDKLETEQQQRKAAHAATKTQLKDLDKQVNTRLAEHNGQLAAQVDELQAVVEEESGALTDLIEKTRAELNKLLSKETARLEQHSVSARDLAQLLTDAARRLKTNGK